MSQFNTSPKAFTAGAAITRFTRVKLDAGKGDTVVTAGAEEAAIGFAEESVEIGQPVAIRLLNTGGTFRAIAAGAVSAGADLFGAASGHITATNPGSGVVRFKALESASAAGAVIEVLPITLN